MRLLFINPADRSEAGLRDAPFALASVAETANSLGHELELLDLNAHREANTPEAIRHELDIEYDVFWFNGTFTNYPELKKLLQLFRKAWPTTVIVVGGKVAQDLPEELLRINPEIDVGVRGSQDVALPLILEKVKSQRWGGIPFTSYREGEDVFMNNDGPASTGGKFPTLEFLPMERYFQGSPLALMPETLSIRHRLSFTWDYDKWPEAVAAVTHVAKMRYRYALDFALFTDAQFMQDPDWLKSFCDEYTDQLLHQLVPWGGRGQINAFGSDEGKDLTRKVKDAGCKFVWFEFDRKPDLTVLGKAVDNLSRQAINPVLKFNLGHPNESFADVLKICDFLIDKKLKADTACLKPTPDTEFFKPYRAKIEEQCGSVDAFLSDERSVAVNLSQWPKATLIASAILLQVKDRKNLEEIGRATKR